MSSFPFAHRTQWSLANNPLSVSLEKLKSQGIDILDLTASNPTQCGFAYPQEWLQSLSDPHNWIYAPEPQGMIHARQAVVDYYARHHYKLDPTNLLLTSSTSEGYSFLLKLLTNPGDHILIPRPSYPLFPFLLELHDVEFDYYPLIYKEGSWHIDQKSFKDLLTPRTKAVIVVNPNNPTGSYSSA